jgi:hypothetical protein
VFKIPKPAIGIKINKIINIDKYIFFTRFYWLVTNEHEEELAANVLRLTAGAKITAEFSRLAESKLMENS